MFCPSCGVKEEKKDQFCRSCGASLSSVRTLLLHPDSITASAIAARDEISRAIAHRIREARSAGELSTISEEVLPQIEKFLESPEERRLRRIRNGSIVSMVGFGVVLAVSLFGAIIDQDFFLFAGAGLITFFIGLALFMNGRYFTVPKKEIAAGMPSGESFIDGELSDSSTTNELAMPARSFDEISSVTDPTTQHLETKAQNHEK